jgi:hemolysin activation/secretion protein
MFMNLHGIHSKNTAKKRSTITLLALFTSSVSLLAFPAFAQVVPGTVAPERIEQRFQQPVEPQAQPTGATPEIQVPQTAISGKLAQQFTLEHVEITNVTAYRPGTFDDLYKGKIGQTITLAEAREIARGITTRYRGDGYVLSQAVIPNQDLKTGVLKIRVVEGFVDKVYVENERENSDRRHLIEGYAAKISAMRPLNTKTLERYMLLISDLPGVTARAIIRPAPSTFGAADLVIKVSNKIWDGSFTSDNRGNKFTGPYQEQLTLTENSLAGLGERTTIRGINTIPMPELHFFDIQHEEQLDTEGTKLVLIYSNGYTHPGDILKPLDLQGTSDGYTATVSHPFIRSRAQNLTGRLTFDARDTENDALGTRLTNDRVRTIRLGGTYDTGDKFGGVDLADFAISQGVPWFSATEGTDTSRPNASRNFTKENILLSRIQTLPHGFSFLTAGSAQYSPHPLFSSEQMTLGGVGFGQAYDSGELSGDSGIAGRAELRYGQPVGYKYLDSYQLYGYYDIGTVWINGAGAGNQDQFSLASTGVGVRANVNSNLYGYLELGFPLTRKIASENNEDPRLFFSVTGRF